jgi:sarcosine oxidase subunit gamma
MVETDQIARLEDNSEWSEAGGVWLKFGAPMTRFILRGGSAAPLTGAAWGVATPDQACRAATVANRAALWLGPDEWLLIAHDGGVDEHQSALEGALQGAPHSLVDVSQRQVTLHVEGPNAARALNAAVPLDLSASEFPVDMCARTIFEKAEIVLWRTGAQAFHVEVWRSFAPYVFTFLDIVRREAEG